MKETNKNNQNMQDDKLKELLSGTKMKASENLKFRIMQQIETEKALSRKNTAKAQSVFGNMFAIFGVMYAAIALVALATYMTIGKEALTSITFYIPVLLITLVCGMYWMITCFDEKRHSNSKK